MTDRHVRQDWVKHANPISIWARFQLFQLLYLVFGVGYGLAYGVYCLGL